MLTLSVHNSEIIFEMNIFGEKSPGSVKSRVIIKGDDGTEYGYNAIREGKSWKVAIPSLAHFMAGNQYPVKIEAIVEGKVFTPYQGSVLVEADISTAKPLESGIKPGSFKEYMWEKNVSR